jgi:hypothetical protein
VQNSAVMHGSRPVPNGTDGAAKCCDEVPSSHAHYTATSSRYSSSRAFCFVVTFLGLARTLVGVLMSILVSSFSLTESTCPSLMLAALQESHGSFHGFEERFRDGLKGWKLRRKM